MDISRLHGVFAPIPSNTDDKDNFLEAEFATNIERLLKEGIHGLYVCGGTGDALLMRVDERKRAAEIAKSLTDKYGRELILHVGGGTLRDAIELAKHGESIGVTALSSLPPMGYSQPQIVDFYQQLAAETSLPILVYNIPGMTHITPTTKEIKELLKIPNVVGLKISAWNIFQIRELITADPNTVIFNGFDEMVGLGMMCGAQGTIGTWINLFPNTYMALYGAVQKKDFNLAVELHNRFTAFLSKAWELYGPVEVFEELFRQAGYGDRCFRRPHADLPEELKAKVTPLLKEVEEIEAASKKLR